MPMLSVIQYEVGQKVGWAMMTLMVLAAIALVVVVLMQKSSGEDMSAIAGYNQKTTRSSERTNRKVPRVGSESRRWYYRYYFL